MDMDCLAIAKFLSASGRCGGELYLRIETADARHERPSGRLLLTLWSEGEEADEEIARVVGTWEEVIALQAMTYEELVECAEIHF